MKPFNYREAKGTVFYEEGKFGGCFTIPLTVRIKPEFSFMEIEEKMEFVIDHILEKFQELSK